MNKEVIQKIRIEPQLESYRTFFDHDWSLQVGKLVAGTKLEEAFFPLCVNWKSAANTHFMPWLMIHSMRESLQGFLQGQESVTERVISAVAEQIPNTMADSLSNMNRKKLAQVIREIGNKAKEVRENEPEINANAIWSDFLNSPGGSEVQLSIWGSQRICYGAIYHAYENFVRHCVGLAREEPEYRAPHKKLVSDAKDVFGEDIAERCLEDEPVKIARFVRNALAHNGGREDDKLRELSHDIVVEDGILQIMPPDNRRLFEELKVRVSKLIEAAASLPNLTD